MSGWIGGRVVSVVGRGNALFIRGRDHARAQSASVTKETKGSETKCSQEGWRPWLNPLLLLVGYHVVVADQSCHEQVVHYLQQQRKNKTIFILGGVKHWRGAQNRIDPYLCQYVHSISRSAPLPGPLAAIEALESIDRSPTAHRLPLNSRLTMGLPANQFS